MFRLPGPSKRASKAAFWRLRFQEAFQDEKSALGGPIWGQVGPPNGSKIAPKAVKNQVKFSIEIRNGSGRPFGPKNGVELPQGTYRAGVGEPMEGGRGEVPSP